jgi:hypothetical protein
MSYVFGYKYPLELESTKQCGSYLHKLCDISQLILFIFHLFLPARGLIYLLVVSWY